MPPAAKHFDPLVGIDVHMIQPPGPVPPVPVPHPYTGMLMDPCDYAPYVGGTVKVAGLQRAQAGTGGISIPKHIPIGGVFVKPPADESEMFMGSSTVAVDGDAFSYLGLPALSCQCIGIPPVPRKKGSSPKSFVLPTTVCLAIPMPVSVGGSPTVSLMALGMKAGMAALGALAKKVKKARAAKRAKGANGVKCNGAHPVDIVSGAVFDELVDARAAAPRLFVWSRYYSSALARESGPLGFGVRHGYQHELRVDVQAIVYRSPTGGEVAFDPIAGLVGESTSVGMALRRIDAGRWELHDRDRPVLCFEATSDPRRPRLVRLRALGRSIELRHDADRLVGLVERGPEGDVVYTLRHDERGRIVELARRDAAGAKGLAAYAYDRAGDLVAARDAGGGTRCYAYDGEHRVLSQREPSGFTFTWEYDVHGRCSVADSQDGLWRTRFAYDPAAGESHVVEPGGGTFVYRYDDNGTLRELVDPYGGVLVREVDEHDGRVLREIDSGGRVMQWMYDARGAHIGRSDAFGHVYPPEVDLPVLPDPLEHRVPETPRAWWLGERSGRAATALPVPPSIAAAHPELLAPQPCTLPRTQRDELGHVVHEVDASGATRHWQRDSAGNEVAFVDRDGRATRCRMVSWNLTGARIDPLGHETRYAWTRTERLAELTDPGGSVSRYEYDEKDRLIRVHRHGRVRDEYRYDAGDQLIEKRGSDGALLLELEYGNDTLPAQRRLATGEVHIFAHDARGRLTRASTEHHEVTMAARPDGAPLSDLRDGVGVTHAYVAGTLRRTEVLGRFVTRYRHEPSGARAIVDPTGATHRVYSGAAGVVLREHAGGRRELVRFDREGRCEARVCWSHDGAAGPESYARWEYTREGDLRFAVDTSRGSTRFAVDDAHRLIGVDGPDGTFAYRHDAAGNLVERPGLVGVLLDEGNRLRFANGESFGYDARNNLATRTRIDDTTVRYGYDALDRLVRIDDGDARGPWTAEYDAIGRRIEHGRADRRTQCWWDGDRLAAEQDADGKLRVYVYASEDAWVPLLFVDYDDARAEPASGRVYTVHVDQLGMPVRIENARGLVVWQVVRADPWGELTIDPHATITCGLRWPGHHFDAETGLHYNRHRYYDPVLGRYLQSDPIGQSGGTNLYAYPSNPLATVDVLGLHPARADPHAAPSHGRSPNAEVPVKRGDVGSYSELKARATVGDALEHDHIPSFAAVRDKMNAERADAGLDPLSKAEETNLRNNLTAAEVDADVHRDGRTHGGKNTEAQRAADGANLEDAAKKDLDAHRDNLKNKGMTDDEIDAMQDGVHDRNREKGVYDKPLPDSLIE